MLGIMQLSSRTRILLRIGVCLLPALLLVRSPLGEWLQLLSFDAAFLANSGPKSDACFSNVVVIGFSKETNERTNHAEVLDRLTDDGAKLVVFDVLFDLDKPEQDERLVK